MTVPPAYGEVVRQALSAACAALRHHAAEDGPTGSGEGSLGGPGRRQEAPATRWPTPGARLRSRGSSCCSRELSSHFGGLSEAPPCNIDLRITFDARPCWCGASLFVGEAGFKETAGDAALQMLWEGIAQLAAMHAWALRVGSEPRSSRSQSRCLEHWFPPRGDRQLVPYGT